MKDKVDRLQNIALLLLVVVIGGLGVHWLLMGAGVDPHSSYYNKFQITHSILVGSVFVWFMATALQSDHSDRRQPSEFYFESRDPSEVDIYFEGEPANNLRTVCQMLMIRLLRYDHPINASVLEQAEFMVNNYGQFVIISEETAKLHRSKGLPIYQFMKIRKRP